jgi:hypothetical protein
MNWTQAEKIADAVLYEGYLLYPYRPSAIKNRQRFNFGVVYPRAYSELQSGSDPWMMQTECLVKGNSHAAIQVKVRCLQLSLRTVGEFSGARNETPLAERSDYRLVEKLVVEDKSFLPWQEAVLGEILLPACQVSGAAQQVTQKFRFPASQTQEEVRDTKGKLAGVIIREQKGVEGTVDLCITPLADELSRVSVTISNTSECENSTDNREAALMRCMLSTHTILCVEVGQFVSLLEPPEELAGVAAECKNVHTWPVLVGERGSTDVMLSSPIILYDYPQIAAESPGDLFDGTEIDEILSLRIMTMTDEEKKEVREADPRGRALLERTETLPPEQLMKLHGVLRGLRSSERKAS